MFRRKKSAAPSNKTSPPPAQRRTTKLGVNECLQQAQGALRKLRTINPGDLQAFPLLNEVQRLIQQLKEATAKLPPADREAWGYQIGELEDEFRELADIVVARADAAPKPEPRLPSPGGFSASNTSGRTAALTPSAPNTGDRGQHAVALFSRQDGFTNSGASTPPVGHRRAQLHQQLVSQQRTPPHHPQPLLRPEEVPISPSERHPSNPKSLSDDERRLLAERQHALVLQHQQYLHQQQAFSAVQHQRQQSQQAVGRPPQQFYGGYPEQHQRGLPSEHGSVQASPHARKIGPGGNASAIMSPAWSSNMSQHAAVHTGPLGGLSAGPQAASSGVHAVDRTYSYVQQQQGHVIGDHQGLPGQQQSGYAVGADASGRNEEEDLFSGLDIVASEEQHAAEQQAQGTVAVHGHDDMQVRRKSGSSRGAGAPVHPSAGGQGTAALSAHGIDPSDRVGVQTVGAAPVHSAVGDAMSQGQGGQRTLGAPLAPSQAQHQHWQQQQQQMYQPHQYQQGAGAALQTWQQQMPHVPTGLPPYPPNQGTNHSFVTDVGRQPTPAPTEPAGSSRHASRAQTPTASIVAADEPNVVAYPVVKKSSHIRLGYGNEEDAGPSQGWQQPARASSAGVVRHMRVASSASGDSTVTTGVRAGTQIVNPPVPIANAAQQQYAGVVQAGWAHTQSLQQQAMQAGNSNDPVLQQQPGQDPRVWNQVPYGADYPPQLQLRGPQNDPGAQSHLQQSQMWGADASSHQQPLQAWHQNAPALQQQGQLRQLGGQDANGSQQQAERWSKDTAGVIQQQPYQQPTAYQQPAFSAYTSQGGSSFVVTTGYGALNKLSQSQLERRQGYLTQPSGQAQGLGADADSSSSVTGGMSASTSGYLGTMGAVGGASAQGSRRPPSQASSSFRSVSEAAQPPFSPPTGLTQVAAVTQTAATNPLGYMPSSRGASFTSPYVRESANSISDAALAVGGREPAVYASNATARGYPAVEAPLRAVEPSAAGSAVAPSSSSQLPQLPVALSMAAAASSACSPALSSSLPHPASMLRTRSRGIPSAGGHVVGISPDPAAALPSIATLPSVEELEAFLNGITGPVDDCRAAAEQRAQEMVATLAGALAAAQRVEASLQQQRRAVKTALAGVVASISQLEADQTAAVVHEDFDTAAALDEQLTQLMYRRTQLDEQTRSLATALQRAATLRVEVLGRQAEAWCVAGAYLATLQDGQQQMAAALAAQADREAQAAAMLHRAAQEALGQRRTALKDRKRELQEADAEISARVAAATEPAEVERQRRAEFRDRLQAEVESLRALLASKEAALAAAEQAVAEAVEAVRQQAAAFDQDKASLEEARALLEAEAAQIAGQEQALEESEREAAERSAAVAEHQSQLRLQAESLGSAASAMRCEAEALTQRVETEARNQEQRERLMRADEATREELKALEKCIADLSSDLSRLAEQRGRVAAERAAAQEGLAALQRSLPELEAAKRAAAANKDFREAARLSGELRAATQQADTAAAQLSSLSAALMELTAAEASRVSELEELRAMVHEAQRRAAETHHRYVVFSLGLSRTALEEAAAAELYEEASALQAEVSVEEAEALALERTWGFTRPVPQGATAAALAAARRRTSQDLTGATTPQGTPLLTRQSLANLSRESSRSFSVHQSHPSSSAGQRQSPGSVKNQAVAPGNMVPGASCLPVAAAAAGAAQVPDDDAGSGADDSGGSHQAPQPLATPHSPRAQPSETRGGPAAAVALAARTDSSVTAAAGSSSTADGASVPPQRAQSLQPQSPMLQPAPQSYPVLEQCGPSDSEESDGSTMSRVAPTEGPSSRRPTASAGYGAGMPGGGAESDVERRKDAEACPNASTSASPRQGSDYRQLEVQDPAGYQRPHQHESQESFDHIEPTPGLSGQGIVSASGANGGMGTVGQFEVDPSLARDNALNGISDGEDVQSGKAKPEDVQRR